MSLQSLKSLINTMPGESTATDADVLAWLKEPVPIVGLVSHGQLIAVCAQHDLIGLWRETQAGAAGATRGLADAALAVIQRAQGLDLADAQVPGLLDSMQAVGLLPQAARDALTAAGTKQVFRWTLAFHREPELFTDIPQARAI